jgi:signal transduction histidine kinase
MPPPVGGARPRSLMERILSWQAVAVLGVLLVLGVVVDRIVEPHLPRSTLLSVRVVLAASFAVAVVVGVLVATALSRGPRRQLRRIVQSLDLAGEGDLWAAVPEEGDQELATLGRAVNRTREGVASMLVELARDRGARDAILSALEDGIVVFDRDGQVLYKNPAAAGLLEGKVRDARSLHPPALREAVFEAMDGQEPKVAEVQAGSSARTLRAAVRPVPEQGSVLVVLRDVTEAKRVESVRRDFVANASHELKTPVAAIQALAETIEAAAGDDPGAVPRFAGQLRGEARRLSRVIADLLDLSRLEAEAGEHTEVQFDRVAAEEAERYRRRAERAGVSLDVAADGPVIVRGSPGDLGLLVRNLVENAIHYTRRGGTVSVSVDVDDGRAVLEVRDSGIGIPSKDQGRIFERFYRVDRARSRETGGTGLGLSIVKHVAENHGGSVSVQSELGRGSRFIVRLPIADRAAG